MIAVLDALILVMVGVAATLCAARVVRNGSIPDKMLGADTLVMVIGSAVVIRAAETNKPYFLDVLIVVTALGFVGTITVARYIEQRGAGREQV